MNIEFSRKEKKEYRFVTIYRNVSNDFYLIIIPLFIFEYGRSRVSNKRRRFSAWQRFHDFHG